MSVREVLLILLGYSVGQLGDGFAWNVVQIVFLVALIIALRRAAPDRGAA